ncbi:hypothetical protein, partial [uncultured Cellulomonas sp.]|uniref:hypothetical protein n=1 Tax=uncultured Cellulomonas sp. TaxID=189682 RepID=UPI0028ECC7A5
RTAARAPGGADVTRLPADQVATTLPTADPAAAPGECGWTVEQPAAASPITLGATLDRYPQQTYSAMPVTLEVKVGEGVRLQDAIDVVVATDGVVVAVASEAVDFGVDNAGPYSVGAGSAITLAACDGPDVAKALPDGQYVLYAVLASADAGLAVSPGEPLAIVGNARERWCGADAAVLPRTDDRVVIAGDVTDDGAVDVQLRWTGTAEAQVLDERVVLVDEATGRIAADSDTWSDSVERFSGGLTPGELLGFGIPWHQTGCADGEPLPAGTYRAYAMATVAPAPADLGSWPATNATAVAELSGTVTVP